MLVLLVFTGLAAAQSDGDRPSYEGVLPSDAQLAQAEPSLERYTAAHSVPDSLRLGPDLSGSRLVALPERVAPGGLVRFSLTVDNSGDQDASVSASVRLPAGFTYVGHECEGLLEGDCAATGGVVTADGIAGVGRPTVIVVQAKVAADLADGQRPVVTALVDSGTDSLALELPLSVDKSVLSTVQILPFTVYGLQPNPPRVTLTAGRVNGSNGWTMTWTAGQGVTGYELQESQTEDFAEVRTFDFGQQTSFDLEKEPSPHNVYHYRVRSLIGTIPGPWSNVETVVGAYFDDFNDPTTGWKLVRTTYLEEVRSYYDITDEHTWYVVQSEDRWDWGIASPGKPAPRLPYVIVYEARMLHVANLQSHGAVFGGDWPSLNGCPSDPSTFDGIYKHQDCFNHFYNTNTIFFGGLKMLFERVDRLEWCLKCGGSPMKRLGDVGNTTNLILVDPEGWNHYRIEVREDSIKYFAGKRGGPPHLRKVYTDTRWVDDPYFGLFVSTDEYSNSWWAIDNYRIMPLDE